MIRYNFCFRGPYEYDKFVLNFLQLYNDAIFMQDSIFSAASGEIQSLDTTATALDNLFKAATEENNNADKLYYLSLY